MTFMGGGIALFLFSIALSAMFKMSSHVLLKQDYQNSQMGLFNPSLQAEDSHTVYWF